MTLLSTNASNTKIAKSQKGTNYRIASLSLMPDLKICAGSKMADCFDLCLKSAGRGVMKNVAAGRQSKTDWWHNDQKGFLATLVKEMHSFRRTCHKQDMRPAFRLNTLSDINWTKHIDLQGEFSDCYFYDYTKIASRLKNTLPNYRLMFSYSKAAAYQKQVAAAIKTQAPVAVVFRGHVPVGRKFLGREIIDGDLSDLENSKAINKVVGLKLKGSTAARSSASPFVVEPEMAVA